MGKYKSSECAYLKLITKNNMSSPQVTSHGGNIASHQCNSTFHIHRVSHSFLTTHTPRVCFARYAREKRKL